MEVLRKNGEWDAHLVVEEVVVEERVREASEAEVGRRRTSARARAILGEQMLHLHLNQLNPSLSVRRWLKQSTNVRLLD